MAKWISDRVCVEQGTPLRPPLHDRSTNAPVFADWTTRRYSCRSRREYVLAIGQVGERLLERRGGSLPMKSRRSSAQFPTSRTRKMFTIPLRFPSNLRSLGVVQIGVLASVLSLPFAVGHADPVISGIASNLNVVTWTGHQWITAGDTGHILTSPDASTWAPCSSATTANLIGVATSGTSTVLIGTETWTKPPAKIDTIILPDGQITTFYLANTITSGIALSSGDGRSWGKSAFSDTVPSQRLFSDDTHSPTAIFWSGSRYVIFIRPYLDPLAETIPLPQLHPLEASADGMTWKPVPFADPGVAIGPVGWFGSRGFAFGSGAMFVATGAVYSAVDDSGWSNIGRLGAVDSVPIALTASGSHFVVVGAGESGYPKGGGAIWTSPDGGTWTVRASGAKMILNAVAHVSGWTLAAGDSGAIVVSRDDSTWIPIPSGTTKNLRGIAANDSIFVLVGDGGTILRIPIASLVAAGLRSRVQGI